MNLVNFEMDFSGKLCDNTNRISRFYRKMITLIRSDLFPICQRDHRFC